jgi:chromosome segregation ATPase
MINSIDLIRNERQIFNSKIIEMNVKVESQSEKINKNYNILNEAINQNNNNLYKDLTIQISKNKDLLENLKDDYDTEISKVRAEINQFDLIIKNNPFLNLNENERLSILFKKEQLKVNETFKNSFYTIEKNFKTIDKKFEAKAKGLEQNMIKLTEIIKDLSDKKAKIKEINYPIEKHIEDVSPASAIKIGELEENIIKMQKNVNNNKQEINDLKEDLKQINEKAIPDIYKCINNKFNTKQELIYNNNNNNNNNTFFIFFILIKFLPLLNY